MKTIILFISVAFLGTVFSSILAHFIPGGDVDTNLIICISIFLMGEVAVCTSIIVDKFNDIKKARD